MLEERRNTAFTRRSFLAGSAAAAAGGLLTGCGSGSGGGGGSWTKSAALLWNDTVLAAEAKAKLGPPATARLLAVVYTAMFDAWAAYDAVALGTRRGADLRRPAAERTMANKIKAISYATYRAAVDLMPNQKADFDTLMAQLGYDINDTSTDTTTPQGVGNVAAKAVLDFRHADGSNQLGDLHPGAYSDYTGYAPVNTADAINNPNRWQPIRFANGAVPGFIGPHWGNVIPFALTTGSMMRPNVSLPQFGSAAYKAQAEEIIEFGAKLDDEKMCIAEYWADGPGSVLPPGHWCLFIDFVSQKYNLNFDRDVQLLFLIGNSAMDASIACWDCKRQYDYCRPVTAIRAAFAGQDIPSWVPAEQRVKLVKGENWVPFQPVNFVTPPFAEYTSGHSTFSASGAEVMRRFLGSDEFGNSVTIPAASLTIAPSFPTRAVTLRWPTFSAAADQAGISRRHGGIHFTPGDIDARRMGRQIGQLVFEKGMAHINGTIQLPRILSR
jgi:hypothetical protein